MKLQFISNGEDHTVDVASAVITVHGKEFRLVENVAATNQDETTLTVTKQTHSPYTTSMIIIMPRMGNQIELV